MFILASIIKVEFFQLILKVANIVIDLLEGSHVIFPNFNQAEGLPDGFHWVPHN